MTRNENRNVLVSDSGFNPFDLLDIVPDFGFDDFGGFLGFLAIGLLIFLCSAIVWKVIDIFTN